MHNQNQGTGRVEARSRSIFIYLFLLIITAAILLTGIADFILPDSISFRDNEEIPDVFASSAMEGQNAYTESANGYTVTAKLFGMIPIKQVNVDVVPNVKLVPSGDVFGVKFFTKGIIVIGMSEIETSDGILNPAEKAGLKVRDIITKVNGKEMNTVEDMAEAVEQCRGKKLAVSYLRDGQVCETELTPYLSLSDKKYKTGLWVRDSTAGIGTVTFFNPENGSFAGLGHGICDVDTGELMPLLRGTIVDIELSDIVKGKQGRPGELKGSFDYVKRGALMGNTNAGVFGILDRAPECGMGEAIPIALKKEVHEGKATIFSNIDGNGVKEYEIEIVKIYNNSEETKNFIINVTDSDLIDKTGGIIQGMSGSPIVQDGKLVGAVTHVYVNKGFLHNHSSYFIVP